MKTVRDMSQFFMFAVLIFTLSLNSGCAKRLPGPDGNNPIARVAVLPMRNNTNHLYAPDWVRAAFHDAITARYYSPISLELVDLNLREKIGLSSGAQLDIDNPLPATPNPQKLGEALGADGLIYSSLEDFTNFVTGVYNKYKIKARFKLVDVRTGKIVWERVEEVADSETNLSASKALKSAKGKIMEIAADHIKEVPRENPLPEPTAKLIEKLINSPVPSGPIGAKR
jgi:hypothetical protein